MADSINNKAKEYYDNDNTGGSLNNNLKDFLKQQGAEGNSLNTLWRNYAYGEGGNSLNTRLGKLWGTSGSLIKRWKDVLGLTWDDLKLFFNARRNDPELLLSGATSFATDDYINTGTPFSNTNHTISAWVNASATGGVVFDNRDANDDGIRLIYDSSLIYQLNSSDVSLSSPSLNTWHHIACTYDGTTQKLYLNGSLVASASTSQTISVSQNLIIGKQSYSDVAYFNGSMANVGIWNRALSASEIESIYWRGQYADLKGTELTNLVSWYNLKDTSLGSEKSPNVTFDSNITGWSGTNWAWESDGEGGGRARHTAGSTAHLQSGNILIVGLQYEVSFTVGGRTAGSVFTRAGASGSGTSRTANGDYTETLTCLTNGIMYVSVSSDFDGYVDNVSFKPIEAPDSTTTNNGSIYGATTLTDAYSASSPFLPRIQDKASDTVANYGEVYGGNAVSFDGSNDYIDIGDQQILTTAGTLSCWVKLDSNDSRNIINKFDSGAGKREYMLYTNASGHISFTVQDSAGSYDSNTDALSSTTLNTGIWYFISATFSTSEVAKLYVDGSLVASASASISDAIDNTNEPIYLGQGVNSGTPRNFFDGKINNVKIFNTALTQDQVRELYTKPELTLPTGVSSSALKLNMPMQEGSGTAILDGSGNQNHGTGSGITWATGQEYGFQHSLVRSNNPMVFDGNDDRITNSFDNSAQDATYSFWAKSSKTTANTVFGHGASNKAFHLNFSAGRPILYLAGTYFKYWNDNSAQDDNQWHHYVVVVDVSDANGSKLYIDGSEQTVSAVNNSVPADAYSQGLTIGAQQQSGGVSFDGMINEFAVWHKFLTANEVTALYNSGLPLLPTADSGNYASADDLVGYWRNDGVITWTDRSTNSNNGTVAGSPASIIVPEGLNEGRDSQGYYLTDTDSISSGIRLKGVEHIEVDNSDAFTFGTGDFSYDFWFKWTDAGHKASVVDASAVMFTSHSTNGNNYSRLMTYQGTLFYTIKYGGSNVRTANSAEGAISNVNTWYHIALTVDRSSGSKWYINGSESTLSGETGATETTDLDFTGKLRIGAINYDESSNGSFIGGSIDEFRIYKGKVLSASEILKNYNNGKSAHSN